MRAQENELRLERLGNEQDDKDEDGECFVVWKCQEEGQPIDETMDTMTKGGEVVVAIEDVGEDTNDEYGGEEE